MVSTLTFHTFFISPQSAFGPHVSHDLTTCYTLTESRHTEFSVLDPLQLPVSLKQGLTITVRGDIQ